jgi:hypothetical protein
MFHGFHHLACIDGCPSFIYFPLIFEDGVEFPPSSVLQDNIDSLLVEKEPIHLQDVLVLEMRMNLNFSSQLIDHILFDNLPFGEDF